MRRRKARRPRAGRTSWPILLLAVVGAPVAWVLHLGASYALVGGRCNGWLGARAFAGSVVAATAVLGGAAIASAVIASGLSHPDATPEHGEPDGRMQFMGRTGLLMAAIFLLLILLETIPPLVVPLCPSLQRAS